MEEQRQNFINRNEINIILENIRMKESDLNELHSLFDDNIGERNKNLFHNRIFENFYEKEKENENGNVSNIEDIEEENFVLEEILGDLNKENQTKKNKACEEILDILKKPIINNPINIEFSPFKPLLKPKQISMNGRVLIKAY
jgi:hypothetical protein